MFNAMDLTIEEQIDYFIKLYEREINKSTKLIILEQLNKLYKKKEEEYEL